MRRHDKMRQHRLCRWSRGLAFKRGPFARDPVRAEVRQQFDLLDPRALRATVGEVDDDTLLRSVDRGVRLIDETPQALRQPMIAPGSFALAAHALLDDDPVAVIGDD